MVCSTVFRWCWLEFTTTEITAKAAATTAITRSYQTTKYEECLKTIITINIINLLYLIINCTIYINNKDIVNCKKK